MQALRKFVSVTIALSLIMASLSSCADVASAASAPPTILSYQGRLTDSGGNLIGGAGTTYYFKFSIWDSPTVGSGNKIWPPSNPATTTATVRQGVFNVNIGDTANGYPDVLNINFANYSQLYLQVEVSADNNSSETLGPRQQLTSSIYAQVAGAVVGSTTPSAFGTTSPAFNSFVTIAATSSNTTGLTIVGAQSQTANLLQIQSNTLANLFSVNGSGLVSAAALSLTGGATTSALAVTGSTTVAGLFNSVGANLLASTTLLGNSLLTNATTTNLAISSIASGNLLKTLTGGAIVAAVAGTDYLTASSLPQAPFPNNATTTLLAFNGGATFSNATSSGTFAVTGSTTITSLLNVGGALNANGTLTVLGNASLKAATTTNLAITNTANTLLKTTATGAVVAAQAGVDYQAAGNYATFGYLFPSNIAGANATSSLVGFTGGLFATASSTIGNGTQAGGLTISGGATTTGNAFIAGNLGINDTSTDYQLEVSGTSGFGSFGISSAWGNNIFDGDLFNVSSSANVGIGTTSPFARLSIQATSTTGINSATTLFAIASSTKGISTSTLFSVSNTGSTTLFQLNSSLLKTNANGAIVAAVAGVDYQAAGNYANFSYLFPNNATTTALAFNGGATFVGATTTALAVTGSSTISSTLNLAGTLNANSGGTFKGITNVNTSQSTYQLAVAQGVVSQSVASFQNTDPAGFSGIDFLDNNGTLQGTVGYSNSGVLQFISQASADARISAGTGRIDVKQSGAVDIINGVLLTGGSNFLTENSTNIQLGASAGGGGGSNTNNMALGIASLNANTTGQDNVAVGRSALGGGTDASYNVAVGNNAITGSAAGIRYNTAVGYNALFNTIGTANVALGYQAGYNVSSGYSNILLGSHISTAAGSQITTGNNNLGLGNELWFPSSTASNQLNIGNLLFGTLPATTTGFRLPTSGALGIGTTSPFAKFAIQTNNGDTATTLFAIGSSTATATTTLFSVSNVGSIQTLLGSGFVGSSNGLLYTFASSSITAASSTLLADSNTFAGVTNAFRGLTSTGATSTGTFAVTSSTTLSSLLNVGGLTRLNGGMLSFASSTIGGGTQATGLTVNGGATTTGSQAVFGTLGVNDSSVDYQMEVAGASGFGSFGVSSVWGNNVVDGDLFNVSNSTNVGIGTTSPFARLSIQATSTSGINSATVLFAIGSSTRGIATSTLFSISNTGSTTIANGVNITSGCYAVNGTCLATGGVGGGAGNWFTPTTFGALAANATSTLIGFNNGLYALASSTIGNGTQFGGLTIFGGATTTGNAYFGGNLGIGTSTLSAAFQIGTAAAASQPMALLSGAWFTGGTLTTNKPQLLIEPSGATSNSWNASGTGLGVNAPEGFIGALAAFQVNGLAAAEIDASGNIVSNGDIYATNMYPSGTVGIGTSTPFANLAVQANNGGTNTTLFVISSSTASATSKLFSISNTGNVTSVVGNSIDNAFTISTSTNNAPIFSVSTRSSPAGLVGIGTSSPWGKLSVEMGPLNPAFVVSNQGSSTPALFVSGTSNNGLVGIGTSSPFAKLSIFAAANDNNPVLFAIGSSTTGASAATLFSVSNTGNVLLGGANPNVLIPNGIDQALNFGTSTGATPTLSISTRSSLNGLVGIGSSTPWGKFSIEMGPLNPAFVVANNGSTSPAFFVSGVNNAGNVGVGTSSPFAKFSIQNNKDDSAAILFAVASSTATTNATLFNIMSNGRVGIGTTSPWAKLSVVTGTPGDESQPAFVLATTTVWNTTQVPLLYVAATTTGAQDYARVAIGATSTWAGSAGLRDQLTVAGRIYSTWRYLACDNMGTNFVTTGSVSGQPANSAASSIGCGAFTDVFNVGSIVPALNANPPYAILQAENGTGATGHGVAVRTGSQFTSSNLNPVFETWSFASTSPTSTSTPMYYQGFTSTQISTVPGTALPTDAVYFIASTSQNWKAVARTGNVETLVDTGVSTSTAGAFQKMRIELQTGKATFIINGVVVAVISTNVPSSAINLAPIQQVVTLNNTNVNASPSNTPQLRTSLLRVWSDDPVNPVESTSTPESVPPSLAYDFVSGADIAEADLVDNPGSYIPGMLVSNATSTLAGSTTPMVRKSFGRYDSDVLGAITTSPYQILGSQAANTVNVAMVGRVPVLVSLENGGIHQGDRIAASSIEGVGMRAARVSNVVGVALSDFTLVASSTCNANLAAQLSAAGVSVPPNACLGTVLVALKVGSDLTIGDVIQDIGGNINDMASALAELTNAAFSKGAELTKYVVGELVAKVAVIDDLFANRVHTKELCVTDDAGGETCVKKAQLDALLAGAAVSGSGSGGGSLGGNAPTTPPTISINGANPATIHVGDTYLDLGATATDRQGHDLTVHTFVNGALLEPVVLDTTSVATDTIEYVATDGAGSTSTSTRTIIISAQ